MSNVGRTVPTHVGLPSNGQLGRWRLTLTRMQLAQALLIVLMLCAWSPFRVFAVSVEDLDPEREWQVQEISISGNQVFSQRELLGIMLTKQRPWYLVWKEHLRFDPVTFATDIQRLEHFYETRLL